MACGGSGGGAKPDGSGAAGSTGAAGHPAAGADGAAGSSGRDAGDGPGTDAGDAPGAEAGDAPTGTAPIELARAPGCGAARLAIAAGKVYWTERATGAVKSLAITDPGGTPAVVAMNQPMPGPIAADDASVYWANEGDKAIMKAPLGGGAAAPLLTAPDVVGGIAASAGTVYYGAGPSAYKVAAAGGAPTTLMTFAVCRTTKVGVVALDVDHLYQTDDNNLYLTREKIDGTQLNNNQCVADPPNAPKIQAPDIISHSQGSLLLDALAVVGAEIIWADNATVNAKAVTGTTSTSGRVAATTLGANAITGFVVAGTNLYFGESSEPPGVDSGDAIEVAPLDPGEAGAADAVIVARGQRHAASFAADAGHVYWVTHTPAAAAGGADDCAIMSLATTAAAAP